MRPKINITLAAENIEWIEKGIQESRFASRSAGVDYALSATRRRESPKAVRAVFEAEEKLRDAEARAHKAEAALDAVAGKIVSMVEDELAAKVSEMVARIHEYGEEHQKNLDVAWGEAKSEQEKRFKAENLGHQYADGFVEAREQVRQLEARIAALEGESG